MQFPIHPMLAKLVPSPSNGATTYPFRHPGWAYEIKWDGERCITYISGSGAVLYSRSGRIINSEFPEIVAALNDSVPKSERPVVLDGEIIWMEQGWPNRQRLMNRLKATDEDRYNALRYATFDCLMWQGIEITSQAYIDRRHYLGMVMAHDNLLPTLSTEDGDRMWDMVQRHSLEGLIAKPVKSRYHFGERGTWVKIKHLSREVYDVVGYTAGEGRRADLFGALILARKDGSEYLYAGKVGTGFTVQSSEQLLAKMKALKTDQSAIAQRDRLRALAHIGVKRPITWIAPALQAEIEFGDKSDDGFPIFPSFKALR